MPAHLSYYSSPPPKHSATLSPAARQSFRSVRASQYSTKLFHVSGGKLFCRPCNACVDHNRKHTVDTHLKSKISPRYFNILTAIDRNICIFRPRLIAIYAIFDRDKSRYLLFWLIAVPRYFGKFTAIK